MENNKQDIKTPYMPELPSGSALFNSKYVVDKFFRTGGMCSDIYFVHDPAEPDKPLIAKIVWKNIIGSNEEQWSKVCNEVTSSMRVKNKPNLIQTEGWFKIDGDQPCIVMVMEYIDGISLRDLLHEKGCLVPKTALNIFLKVLNGIKSLHNFKHQIIHRDLKPDNILMSKDLSKVVVIDFGISTVIKRNAWESSNVKADVVDGEHLYGSNCYIIPDAIREYNPKKNTKDRIITVQYDFFSLGIILYEMLIGKPPFDAAGLSTAKAAKLPLDYDMLNISSNPSIPVALENIIFRCIASKPEDLKFRYNSIEEIIDDINKVIPMLTKDDSNVKLLKPTEKRMYQKAKQFNTDFLVSKQKAYKQTWFCILTIVLSIAILIACIVVFFVLWN